MPETDLNVDLDIVDVQKSPNKTLKDFVTKYKAKSGGGGIKL